MKIFLTALVVIISMHCYAQVLTIPPNGGNKKAWVGERVGLTDVTIMYDRPGVKGREGKIWGQLVHYGFKDLGFGTSTASPWRAGANENTTIEFSNPVKIEGMDLPAGKYGFMIDVEPEHCVLIFNKRTSSWGSYFYDPKEDALRVTVKQVTSDKSVEWLKYEFSNESASGATISLMWEKWIIPCRVETDLKRDQLEVFRKELSSSKSFDYKNWEQAAAYTSENNVDLEEGLGWADRAIMYGGASSFSTLSTKASILEKLQKQSEAEAIMKNALSLGSKEELFNYGTSLIKKNQKSQAMDVFKINYNKYPKDYLSSMGMARGYSAMNDFSTAVKYANNAYKLSQDESIKSAIKIKIKMLENKQDIN